MPDGPVYTGVLYATYETLLKSYCYIDGTDYDSLLEEMFDAGKRKADEYLNNPFEELNPTVVFSSVVATDYIVVNGKTYTAAATGDEEELEFALGSSDSDAADNFVALVNSTTYGGSYGAVGVRGVLATNTTGTVKFTRKCNNLDPIVVSSSDEDKLLVRQVLDDVDIPEAVIQWLFQFVKRHFDNRDALIQDTTTGQGTKMWLSMKSEEAGMVDNFSLIDKWRLSPGF